MKIINEISIFILIDALGWDYIKNRNFLNQIAVTKRPVKSILGFSSGVIPSILTGKNPQEHNHWSLFFYSLNASPFAWMRRFTWLPKELLNSRLARKIAEEISKRKMGYTGYFETYSIPVEYLNFFDISENKNIYKPKGIRNAKSIFDIFVENKLDYKCFTYPLSDKEIFSNAKTELKNSSSGLYFLYLAESDALLHNFCKNQIKINKMIDHYEKEIIELYQIAQKSNKKVNMYIFSDHGMAKIENSVNLKGEIENLGFKIPQDYVPFYDSTMARFWFFTERSRETITRLLQEKTYGKILTKNQLIDFGIDFNDNMYGELIFLMNAGVVINPSFIGNAVPEGMHGFDINDGAMDAILVSNVEIKQEIQNVKDFFRLMSQVQNSESHTKNKIKVLYFLNSIVRAGVEEHVLRLIEGLDKEKIEPVLACPPQLIELMKFDLQKLQIKIYPVFISRWRHLKEIWNFIKILNREKPDIVHSHLFFATRFAAPLAKLFGVQKVIDTSHLREAWRKGIKRAYFIDRFFYRFVDKIIAVSNAVESYLVTEKKLPPEKITVIRNGIDIDKFKPVFNNNPSDRFYIGVIGRLEPQKGHRYFFEAIKMLEDKLKNVKCLIIGDGKLRLTLEKMCHDLDISDKVEFLGFKNNIQAVIARLDLLVLPSLYEGLPLVALEAGAMGKPIIVTNVDGSPEAVINGETGLVVPPRNSEAIKEAIEKIFFQNHLVEEFGRNAREYIKKEFDLKKQILKTEELYIRLL